MGVVCRTVGLTHRRSASVGLSPSGGHRRPAHRRLPQDLPAAASACRAVRQGPPRADAGGRAGACRASRQGAAPAVERCPQTGSRPWSRPGTTQGWTSSGPALRGPCRHRGPLRHSLERSGCDSPSPRPGQHPVGDLHAGLGQVDVAEADLADDRSGDVHRPPGARLVLPAPRPVLDPGAGLGRRHGTHMPLLDVRIGILGDDGRKVVRAPRPDGQVAGGEDRLRQSGEVPGWQGGSDEERHDVSLVPGRLPSGAAATATPRAGTGAP